MEIREMEGQDEVRTRKSSAIRRNLPAFCPLPSPALPGSGSKGLTHLRNLSPSSGAPLGESIIGIENLE